MNTVQTNVRVPPSDKPLLRAIAARLRIEPHFRDRLQSLIEEDPTPALQARIERLEEQFERLLDANGGARATLTSRLGAAPRTLNGGTAA